MPIVGEADVIITAVTTQLEQKIKTALDSIAHDAEHGGGDAGDKWGEGFEGGSRSHFKNVVDQVGTGLASGGLHEGESYGHNVSQGISHGLGDADRDIGNIGRKLANAGEGAGDAIVRDVTRGLGDAEVSAGSGGNDIGKAVADGVSNGASAIGDWASILKIGGLVAAIGIAAGAIANLVAGLFAIVSAAAPAAAALAAFIPIAGGLAFSLGTAALGFFGVFKAVSALNKQQSTAGASAKTFAQQQQAAADRVISAREAVQRAEESLATAEQSAADDRVNAAHSVEQAELALARAHLNEAQAQKDLIAARQQAANQLIQLSFQTRQAAISEREASLALADAQLKFEETISDPRSTARAKEDAKLAVQQAQLSLDEATQRNTDAQKAQTQAQKEGVNGSAAVVQAQQRVKDAHQSVIDSEFNLAHIRHANAEQVVKDQQAILHAAQAVVDTQRSLKEALQAQKDVINKVGAGANAAQQALKNLSPQAIQFAKFLVSLKPLFIQLQGAASGMFLPIENGIKAVVANFFPTLVAGVSKTSTAIGKAFEFISKSFIANPLFNSQFKKLVSANASGLSDLAAVITNLLKAFTQLAVDAIPLAERFAGWLVDISRRFAEFVSQKSVGGADSPIARFFKLAGDRAALLGDIIKQVARIFFGWGKGADATGLDLLKTFDKVAKKFADGLGSKEGQQKLHNFFVAVEPGFKALSALAGALLSAFAGLAASPGLKTVADQLRTGLLPMLQQLINYFNTNIAPKIVPILTDIGRVISNIVNSGILQTVIRDLGALAHVIAEFAASPVVGFLIGHMGNLLAAFIAFKVLQKFTPFDEFAAGLSAVRGGLSGTITEAALAKSSLGRLAGAFREVKLASKGAADLGAIGVGSGKLSFGQKATAAASVLGGGGISKATGEVSAVEGAMSRVLEKGSIFARLGAALAPVIEGIGTAFGFLLSPIGIAVAAIGVLIGTFIYAYKTSETVRKNVSKILTGLKQAFLAFIEPIVKVVQPAFVKLANAIGIHGKDIGAVMHTLGADVRKAWEAITGAFVAALPTIKVIMAIIGTVIADAFKVAFFVIIPFIKINIAVIKAEFTILADVIKIAILIVRDIIVSTWAFIHGTVLPVVEGFVNGIKSAFHAMSSTIHTVMSAISSVVSTVWNAISKTIGGVIGGIESTVKTVFGRVRDFLSTVFSGVGGFFKTAFGDVEKIITAPINALLGALRTVLHAIGQIHFHVKRFDPHIPGVGKIGGFDFGLPDLSGNIPTHLSSGGIVPASSTGLLALLGEGGKRERVEPLDSSGMSKRDRVLIETIVSTLTGGKSGQPIQIDVHPSQGMDEREVALQTSRELAWRLGVS